MKNVGVILNYDNMDKILYKLCNTRIWNYVRMMNIKYYCVVVLIVVKYLYQTFVFAFSHDTWEINYFPHCRRQLDFLFVGAKDRPIGSYDQLEVCNLGGIGW